MVQILGALHHNLAANCPEAIAHALALSDKEGEFEMVACSHDSGAASLEQQYRVERLTELGYPTSLKQITVHTVPFSQFVTTQDIDFSKLKKAAFKIDVEGHELAVLAGMELFLRSYDYLEMLIVVEVHSLNFDNVKRFFEANDFKLSWPDAEAVTAFHQRDGAAIDLIYHRPRGTGVAI